MCNKRHGLDWETNLLEDCQEPEGFMPVKKVLSEKEQMRQEETEQSIYRGNDDLNVKMAASRVPLCIPFDLMAYAHHVGDVSRFSPAKRDSSNKLGEISTLYSLIVVIIQHLSVEGYCVANRRMSVCCFDQCPL